MAILEKPLREKLFFTLLKLNKDLMIFCKPRTVRIEYIRRINFENEKNPNKHPLTIAFYLLHSSRHCLVTLFLYTAMTDINFGIKILLFGKSSRILIRFPLR